MSHPRTVAACLLAVLLGLGCALAVGCGSTASLLPRTDAASLEQTLTQVDRAVAARDCDVTETTLARLQRLVADLPPSVDRGLRTRLAEEIDDKLAVQARSECGDAVTDVIPTTTTPVPTTPSTTSPTPSTSTEPPATEPPATEPPATEPPATTPSVPAVPDPGADGDSGGSAPDPGDGG